MRAIGWLVVVGLVAGAPALALAEEEKEEAGYSPEAKKKFNEGNEHYAKGEYDAAIESFKAAIAADPKLPGPYRNLGLAYRALNRCSDALPMYEKYLQIKPESRFTDRVRREIDLCRAKLGMQPLQERPHYGGGPYRPGEAQSYLHVAADLIGGEATDEASVAIDGVIRGSTPLTIPITAGKHRVHLERAGFEKMDVMVDVLPGQRQEVELTMHKLTEPAAPAVAATEEERAAAERPKGSYRKYAWTMVGVAGALAIMGAGFGIAESHLYAQAITADRATTTRGQVQDDAATGSNFAVGAYVGLSVGAAALIASCVLFIADPARGETHAKQSYTKPSYTIAPAVGAGSAGIAAAGRF
jgi:hypothetical protein